MLTAENLGKRYGKRWLFRGLTFEVAQGHRLVVLGQNGSGKSTLLRTLSGLLTPSEGKVGLPPGDPRHVLGLSALEMALYPQMTVAEHLEFSGSLRGCEPRTEELLNLIGLVHARDLFSYQLSTGMKARVKLAMAIQARPQVLILDEPGAGLDEAGRSLIEAVCEEQTERGCVILATNDPLERRLATHELELV